MEHSIVLDKVVTGFAVTKNYIDCMSGKNLIKYEKQTGKVVLSKAIFEKEGFSRNLVAHSGQLFIYDFCTLYVFDQNNYELLCKKQLGTIEAMLQQ